MFKKYSNNKVTNEKIINTIDNDDTLTIYIEEKEYSEGVVDHLGLKFENGELSLYKEYYNLIRQAKNSRFNYIPAKVEKKNWTLSNNIVILNKGKKHGVKKNMGVFKATTNCQIPPTSESLLKFKKRSIINCYYSCNN